MSCVVATGRPCIERVENRVDDDFKLSKCGFKQTVTSTLFMANLLTNGWAVNCPWMVTTPRMLSFIFMRPHVLSGRTSGCCVTGMSFIAFASRQIFEAVVTPVACFGAKPRAIRIPPLRKLDPEWRRLLRCMVGPPSGLDWSVPWHEVVRSWNQHFQSLQLKSWSCKCLHSY